MVRDLAKRRDSIDRRQLYYALVKAVVWTPVSASSAVGHIEPGDLHPLDREGLAGRASFAFFSHEAAAKAWQDEEGQGTSLRLERIEFVDLLPLLLGAGAGSAYINPAGKFTGEFYRHELETMMTGAQKLASRSAAVREPQPMETPQSTFWQRIRRWWV